MCRLRTGCYSCSDYSRLILQIPNGNSDLEDMPRSWRPTKFNKDNLKMLLKKDGRRTFRELAEKMNGNAITFSHLLQLTGFNQKLGAWVPHELTQNNKSNRLQIAVQHLARNRETRSYKKQFLYWIVTGNKKWCLYVNVNQRKEWMTPVVKPMLRVKQNLHSKKDLHLMGLEEPYALKEAWEE